MYFSKIILTVFSEHGWHSKEECSFREPPVVVAIFHHLLFSPFVSLSGVVSPLCPPLNRKHKTTCKSNYLSVSQIWKSSPQPESCWTVFQWVYFLPRNSDHRPHTLTDTLMRVQTYLVVPYVTHVPHRGGSSVPRANRLIMMPIHYQALQRPYHCFPFIH